MDVGNMVVLVKKLSKLRNFQIYNSMTTQYGKPTELLLALCNYSNICL